MAEGLTPVYTNSGSIYPADWGNIPTSNSSTWNEVICDRCANGYSLPTEAEREFAARGATNTPDYLYSDSDDIDAVAWLGSKLGQIYHPIGGKDPNGLGIYDMSDNVFEEPLCILTSH